MKSLQLTPTPCAAPRVEVPEDAEIFVPENVCAKMIRFAVENGRLVYVRFTGGCDGNLKALSALVTGMRVEDVLAKLGDITCGGKGTSCAAQLCAALRNAGGGNGR
ncbi:TIGR03905 family TSCPD domain-containing protein [Pseudodesulfovibrio sp.]|uniref:TIGR03905 family TSCPD domain-containing protein n=1 Tax=Pseudodesulfovibrio sp. TaxID=2035812 RepID=UPI00262BC131|nr:TIGR03905 family TSCPD domain-containing protein [Pseudodesulfovibrio sp.]MDD3310785.1 TIGR03905 family TSCPD domain-containing protein [Pseudodesulfovibrio sp.]